MLSRITSVCLLLTLAVAGCSGPAGPVQEGGDIILGGVFNLEGSQREIDFPAYRGAQLALDEINASGGVLGRNLRLVVADGKSQPEELAKAVKRVLAEQPGVSAFLGLSDTDMVLAAAPVAAESGRLFLTSGATSPHLPAEIPRFLYRACFGDNVQAAAAAEFAFEQLGARSASVLYDSNDTYTKLLQGYFVARFVELGGDIRSSEAYSPGELSGPISRLKQADVVFLSASPPHLAVEAVDSLRAAGFSVPILGGDGFDSSGAWISATGVSDVYFTTHVYLGADAADQQVQSFREAYAAANPGSPESAFAALGYDALKLIAEAIRQGGSAEPSDVLASLSAIRDFDGVTGMISYDDESRIPRKSVSIIEVNGGSFRLVREWTPAGTAAP